VSRRVFEKKERKIKLLDGTFHCTEDPHIRVDTTNGNGEHAIEIRAREKDKGDQISHSEGDGEEACLDGTTNKSIQNRIRLAKACSRTGQDDDQCN